MATEPAHPCEACGREKETDLSPPWVLFIDKGKPVAILPAGRPGEVANVSDLTMRDAQGIVDAANRLGDALFNAKLRRLGREIAALTRRALAGKDKR